MDHLANNKTHQATQPPPISTGKANTTTNCPKMGSRRIFTPQFKLQVLESYRNDHDCKGNQRATARKYNIHRRQIQKWLQCEASLRSSVVNINQNAVKHQFHNVSMQQQQQQHQQQQQQQTKNVVNGLNCSTNHLCLEGAKGSSTSHKTLEVPSCLSSSISLTSSIQETRDILTSNSEISSAAASIVSPLRPSAIMSATKNTNASMSSALLHHHHHHHYGLQTFSSLSPPSTVPILVHHLNNTQQIYQYENIHYAPAPPPPPPTLTHHQAEKDHTTTYLAPLVLPPSTATANNSYTTLTNSERFDKFDMILMGAKTYSKSLTDKSFLYNTNHQFHSATNNHESSSNNIRFENSSNTAEASFSINQFTGDSTFSSPFAFAPMDLSLRPNKEIKTELTGHITASCYPITESPLKRPEIKNVADVVDLTYRKRRVSISTNQSTADYTKEYRQKHQKLNVNTEEKIIKPELNNKTDICNATNCQEDDDIEIEVGTEEKFPPTSSKPPVKLFKPYLLDEEENENNDDNHLLNCKTNNNKLSKIHSNDEEVEKKGDTTLPSENIFLDAVKENINMCVDSTTNFFVESRSESPRSVCSPATTYVSTLSPTNFQYAIKGSPSASSGYESSTSTYSDTSLSSSPSSTKNDTYCSTYGGQTTTYSLNLQMQTIYHENNNINNNNNIHHQVIHPTKHDVQRWLEKDDSNSLETNSTSIALFV